MQGIGAGLSPASQRARWCSCVPLFSSVLFSGRKIVSAACGSGRQPQLQLPERSPSCRQLCSLQEPFQPGEAFGCWPDIRTRRPLHPHCSLWPPRSLEVEVALASFLPEPRRCPQSEFYRDEKETVSWRVLSLPLHPAMNPAHSHELLLTVKLQQLRL